jgi:hypothetical protein
MRITHTEFQLRIYLRCKTKGSARSGRQQFTNKIEDSIHDATLDAARLKVKEFIKAGRLAKGFGVELMS